MGVVVTFVVVTLVVAVVGPVAGQIQGVQQGRFQLHSCEYLVDVVVVYVLQ